MLPFHCPATNASSEHGLTPSSKFGTCYAQLFNIWIANLSL